MTTLYMVYYDKGDHRARVTKHPVPEYRAREIIAVASDHLPGNYVTEPPLPTPSDSAEHKVRQLTHILSECRALLATATFESVPAQLRVNRLLGLIDGAIPKE